MEDAYLTMSLAGISSKKQLELVQKFGSSENVWMSFSRPHILETVLGKNAIDAITNIINSSKLQDFKFGLQKIGVNYITIEDERYSKRLKEIFDPPTVLYYIGDISLLNSDAIAIVGSRTCTNYGREQTKIFSRALTEAGFVIVSGLAEGIDGIAQKECINCGGKTIAVLAGKIHDVYPAIHKELADEIVKKGGLLICETLPTELPRYGFVQRNRIIAGLALGVLVPEAGEKSGSLHTVEFANDYGRHIFAIPGPVSSSKSVGTNRLIKCFQGCCVTEPNDVIKDFPGFLLQNKKQDKMVQLDMNEQLILGLLEDEAQHYSLLVEKTGLDLKTLNSLLTRMEIRGLIVRMAGNYYQKKID